MAQYSIKMGPREENWKVNFTLEIQPDVIGEIFVQCGVLSFTRRSLELAVEQHRRSNFRDFEPQSMRFLLQIGPWFQLNFSLKDVKCDCRR